MKLVDSSKDIILDIRAFILYFVYAKLNKSVLFAAAASVTAFHAEEIVSDPKSLFYWMSR